MIWGIDDLWNGHIAAEVGQKDCENVISVMVAWPIVNALLQRVRCSDLILCAIFSSSLPFVH